jgi:hypothetical protein
MVRAAASCLNQDFQDFEDFLALGVGSDGARSNLVLNQDFEDFLVLGVGSDGARSSQLFESGFRGFFSIGRWVRWCAQQPIV